jgi:hypothetical protein
MVNPEFVWGAPADSTITSKIVLFTREKNIAWYKTHISSFFICMMDHMANFL